MSATLLHGDCLEVLPTLEPESVDACVTDPPYGLSFMGKDWDHGVPGEHFWQEVSRVLKPGAHLLAFGGTRTFHRLTCAIEDAGFEVRDCLMWLYGSGFPKSLDASKAMDKAAGAERACNLVPTKRGNLPEQAGPIACGATGMRNESAPVTALARQWQGWGTALKPAWEPIILARKPLIGTVAANVERYSTGAVNVDGCRIGTEDRLQGSTVGNDMRGGHFGAGHRAAVDGPVFEQSPAGRWPANLILDEDAGAMLDGQSGKLTSGVAVRRNSGGKTFGGEIPKPPMYDMAYPDSGGASRFFYCAKASRSERNAGLEGLEEKVYAPSGGAQGAASRGEGYDEGQGIGLNRVSLRQNHHPTVKPIALMRYLCRLVTQPGGTVLDPFMGSGSTGCGAVQEGFAFTGVEIDADYLEIASRRIEHWQERADHATAQGVLI